MSKTPSETLRSAAKLMRERAEAATPGPWATRFVPPGKMSLHQLPPQYMVVAGQENVANASELAAPFIASWHPAVALAVADWLDNEASAAEAIPSDSPVLGPLVRH